MTPATTRKPRFERKPATIPAGFQITERDEEILLIVARTGSLALGLVRISCHPCVDAALPSAAARMRATLNYDELDRKHQLAPS